MPNPVNYRVLIEIPKSEERARLERSGLVLPEEMLKREDVGNDIGIIRKIGKTAFKADLLGGLPEVKEGDRVYYVRYGGHVIKTKDGTQYRFINDEDIFGTVDDDELTEETRDV